MTPEQIIGLAKQAGIWQPLGLPSDWDSGDYAASPHQLQTFAKLVRNAALEECAEVCGFGMSMTEKEMHIAEQIRSLKS